VENVTTEALTEGGADHFAASVSNSSLIFCHVA